MRISERNLKEFATAYIEDGKLKKWRYYSEDINHIDRILSDKQLSQEVLTPEDIDYIKTLKDVVIVDEMVVTFYNFSGRALRF